jgi:hypothetical protein
MTNSASEPGADDVLASIRRLIQATPDRPAGAGGRLLLTPALRVADPDDEPAAPAPAPAPRVLTLEDRIAELEAAVGSQATEFEPDGSEVAHVSPPEELVRAVQNLEIEVVDEFVPMTPAPEAVVEAEVSPQPEPEPQRPARGLFLAVPSQDLRDEAEPEAKPVAEVPAGLFFTRHDRPADETEGAEAAPELVAEVATGIAADVVAEASPVIDATEAFGAVPAPSQDEVGTDATAQDEAPHQEVEVEDDWQDDAVISPVWTRHAAPLVEDAAPEPMPAFRHAATAARGGSEPADAASVAPDATTDAAPAIDDAQLRALIATLLREELQGPLGERITRNIRKLVRREIERALAVRDFD